MAPPDSPPPLDEGLARAAEGTREYGRWENYFLRYGRSEAKGLTPRLGRLGEEHGLTRVRQHLGETPKDMFCRST